MDGLVVGTTPMIKEQVRPGRHKLKVRCTNCNSHARTINVVADKTVNLLFSVGASKNPEPPTGSWK